MTATTDDDYENNNNGNYVQEEEEEEVGIKTIALTDGVSDEIHFQAPIEHITEELEEEEIVLIGGGFRHSTKEFKSKSFVDGKQTYFR